MNHFITCMYIHHNEKEENIEIFLSLSLARKNIRVLIG